MRGSLDLIDLAAKSVGDVLADNDTFRRYLETLPEPRVSRQEKWKSQDNLADPWLTMYRSSAWLHLLR